MVPLQLLRLPLLLWPLKEQLQQLLQQPLHLLQPSLLRRMQRLQQEQVHCWP